MATSKKLLSSPQAGTALVPCRLPVAPAVLTEIGLDSGTWAVLTDSIFPSARTPEGVMLAVRYCQARKLDIMRRPVHVVPMWSTALNREVETVWPGIAEVQTTAARTGGWAGLDAPRFGPEVTRTFRGTVKRDGRWEEREVTVTFHEWAEVTVYRMVGGVRCAFTETVFWEEAYARSGRGELPNEMWQKRPRGQHVKCAKAASLRAAFPEETGYTAEEMEGKTLEGHAPIGTETIDADVISMESAKTPGVEGHPAGVSTAPAAVIIDEAVKSQVDKLIERAARARAWGQAEDYLRSRFNGAHLEYALAELEKAAQESVAQAKAA